MAKKNKISKDIRTFTRYYFSDVETIKFKDKDLIHEIYDNLEEFCKKDAIYELPFILACIIQYNFKSKKEILHKYFLNENEYIDYIISLNNTSSCPIFYFHNLSFDSKYLLSGLANQPYKQDKVLFDNIEKETNEVYRYKGLIEKIQLKERDNKFVKVKFIKTGNRIIAIFCYKKSKSGVIRKCLEFRDSYSLLITKLSDLGKYVDCLKLDFDFDYRNKEQYKKAIEYCYQDCRIIYKAIEYLISAFNKFFSNKLKKEFIIKDIPLTIASLVKKAMILYYPIVFYRNDAHFEDNLRKFYYGGRVEVFNFNKIYDCCYLDVNSEYPFVLSKHLFALGKSFRYVVNKFDGFKDKRILCYEMEIIENQYYPLFCERLENGKIIFKNGKKNILMSSVEYKYLFKNGLIGKEIKILKVFACYYSFRQSNFKEFFEFCYYTRKSYGQEHFFNYFLKIFMNSGYGKFGQKPLRNNLEILLDLQVSDLEKLDNLYEKDGIIYRNVQYLEKYQQINLLNAVLTTNYARLHLWKMINRCYKWSIDVYYVDTDSIVIEKKDLIRFKKYLNDDILGKWKIETTFKEFQAIDSKEYYCIIENKKQENEFLVKLKGIKKENLKDFDDIKEFYREGVLQNLIASPLYCLYRHRSFNTIFIMKKNKVSYYDKREILKDLTTKPYEVLTESIVKMNSDKIKGIIKLM